MEGVRFNPAIEQAEFDVNAIGTFHDSPRIRGIRLLAHAPFVASADPMHMILNASRQAEREVKGKL